MDTLIDLLKILLFGFLLNPYLLGVWGLGLLMSMGSREGKNRTLKMVRNNHNPRAFCSEYLYEI